MSLLHTRIQTIQDIIEQLTTESVTLMVASKYHSIDTIWAAHQAGLINFGENTLQGALPKIKALQNTPIQWHFIGRLQSNKIKKIGTYFDWVHTATSLTDLIQLNAAAHHRDTPLNVCIQVGLYDAVHQRHCPLAQTTSLIESAQSLPYIQLRGFMYLPMKNTSALNTSFQTVAQHYQTLKHMTPDLDTLCMGMSQDYTVAIQAGANMVRLGRAILGEPT